MRVVWRAESLWHNKDSPKIQILTIEGLLSGKERVDAPPQMNPFAQAQREGKPEKQTDLIECSGLTCPVSRRQTVGRAAKALRA